MNSIVMRGLCITVAASLFAMTAGGQTRPAASRIGKPSASALTSARDKEDAMRRPNGPPSVTLSANEMASLVEAGLEPDARRAIDSVSIRLDPGRLSLQGFLVTSALGTDVFGPLAAMFNPLEPLWVSGPAHATSPGVVAWEPDTFMVRNMSLPQSAIPMLVKRLTGALNGAIPIAVPPTVSRITIDAGTVTFSRR
ncbi:MAG: hypothetical protein EXR93_01790 [Gemmatimonadetes bacterium]|nr:hypothetical protein [Gemmatimonadota bacterium]